MTDEQVNVRPGGLSSDDGAASASPPKASIPDAKLACYCSFCQKSDAEVFVLVAGPMVFICDECVTLCNDIILDRKMKKVVADAVASHFAAQPQPENPDDR